MSRSSYVLPYCFAAVLAMAYVGLVCTICAAGATLQVNWSFTWKLFLFGGIFIFVSIANLIFIGNSAYILAKQQQSYGSLTNEEIMHDEGFIEGFRAGMIVENIHSAPHTPTRSKDWHLIILVSAALIGFVLCGVVVKRLLDYKDKLNS